MNYRNDGNKRDEGGPVIGKLGASFKKTSPFSKPLFSKTAGSIMERIKNLSKKDMAFVVVGLSVLVAAPVAEYLMSKPTSDNQLTSGFGARGDGGSSLYEPGINSLSQGSPDGSGEVITPLSSRDPSSLIIGSQPAAPAPVTSPPPSSGFRDAMKDAGRQAFSDVAKSAGAPVPIPKMQSGFRGIGSFLGGDGGGSRTTGGVDGRIMSDARNASGKAAGRTMVSPKATTDYKGVAYKPGAASRGAMDKLRAQAGRAAIHFSDGGATGALDRAAAESPEARGIGSKGPGEADDIKSPATYDGHGKNSWTPPESLENLAAKFRLQKQLEWEEYLKHGIAKEIIGAMVGAFGQSLGKFVGKTTDKLLGQGEAGAVTYYCVEAVDPAVKPYPCVKGNVHIRFESNEEKTISSWQTNSKDLCPCGVWSKDGYATQYGGGGSGPAPTGSPQPTGSPSPTANPSPSPSPTGAPQPVNEMFGSYDEVLKQMYMARTDGQKAPDAVALMNKTMEIAGGFANLKANAVADGIKNSQPKEEAISGYAQRIVSAKMDIMSAKSDYNIFKAKFDNVMAAAKAGTLKLGSASGQYGAKVSLSEAVMPFLNTADESFKLMEKNNLAPAENQIAFNEKALEVYKQQVQFTNEAAANVNKEYMGSEGVLGSAEKIYKELDQIKQSLAANAAPTAEQQDTIINDYKAVSGLEPTVKPVTPVPAPVTTSAKELDAYAAAFNTKSADFRDEVAAPQQPQQAGLIAKPIAWRGLKADVPFTQEGKANDADAVKKEQENWAKATPLQKKTIDELQALNNVEQTLLAASMRNVTEIPTDAKNQAIDPGAAATLLTPLKDQIEKVTKRLTAAPPDGWGINMDDPAGGNAPSPSPSPTPGTGTGTTPNTNININNQLSGNGSGTATQKDLPSQISAAKKTAGDNLSQMTATAQATDTTYNKFPASTCKAGQCQSAFGKAQQYRAALNDNVVAVRNLQKELDNPNLTQADVDRINGQLATQRNEANRNKEQFDQYMDRADQLRTKPSSGGTHPTTSPKPTPTPTTSPKPTPPPVVAVQPPASIDQVGLVKGRTTIPAFDGKGQPLYADKCVKWGVGWQSGFTGQPVCKQYVKERVMVTVNDYHIGYGRGEPLPLRAGALGPNIAQTPGGKVWYQDASIKREEYDMEVKVSCTRQGNSWLISYAGLRKGLASSSDALGGKVSAGWDLGPKITAEVNYQHSWNHFRNGEMLPYAPLVNQPCR